MKHRLLIATENKGKRKEFQELLAELPNVELVIPSQLGINLNVNETGSTYAENAALKARAYAQAANLIALADDSGLEVAALNGAPGLYSARYAPMPNATDADRRAYLLQNLQGKPQPWSAHFHASIAIALPNGDIHFTEGRCDGQFIAEERGHNGFGYDPIFFMPELGHTMAELPTEEKNRLSHRARAVQQAVPVLLSLFG